MAAHEATPNALAILRRRYREACVASVNASKAFNADLLYYNVLQLDISRAQTKLEGQRSLLQSISNTLVQVLASIDQNQDEATSLMEQMQAKTLPPTNPFDLKWGNNVETHCAAYEDFKKMAPVISRYINDYYAGRNDYSYVFGRISRSNAAWTLHGYVKSTADYRITCSHPELQADANRVMGIIVSPLTVNIPYWLKTEVSTDGWWYWEDFFEHSKVQNSRYSSMMTSLKAIYELMPRYKNYVKLVQSGIAHQQQLIQSEFAAKNAYADGLTALAALSDENVRLIRDLDQTNAQWEAAEALKAQLLAQIYEMEAILLGSGGLDFNGMWINHEMLQIDQMGALIMYLSNNAEIVDANGEILMSVEGPPFVDQRLAWGAIELYKKHQLVAQGAVIEASARAGIERLYDACDGMGLFLLYRTTDPMAHVTNYATYMGAVRSGLFREAPTELYNAVTKINVEDGLDIVNSKMCALNMGDIGGGTIIGLSDRAIMPNQPPFAALLRTILVLGAVLVVVFLVCRHLLVLEKWKTQGKLTPRPATQRAQHAERLVFN